MKRILTSLALVAASVAFSQVSISGETNDVPQATLDVKAITGKANGILVPRVTRAEAAVMAKPTDESGAQVDIVESTLIYVNVINGTASGYATDVDAVGFYYFKDGKWVKLGGATASQKTLRSVVAITEAEWENNQYGLVQTGTAAIQLPDPTQNKNRIIVVSNDTNTTLNYAEPSPARNSTIRAGKGQVLMSDGNKWYIAGGY